MVGFISNLQRVRAASGQNKTKKDRFFPHSAQRFCLWKNLLFTYKHFKRNNQQQFWSFTLTGRTYLCGWIKLLSILQFTQKPQLIFSTECILSQNPWLNLFDVVFLGVVIVVVGFVVTLHYKVPHYKLPHFQQ